MKAYVTSVGEKTTKICCEQLEKLGFEVVLMDRSQRWIDKYKEFVKKAEGPCIRVDADVVVNKNLVTEVQYCVGTEKLVAQFYTYDFYQNNYWYSGVLFYSQKALDEIKRNFAVLDPQRPEASACRLPAINDLVLSSKEIVGMHGFFQNEITMERAEENKKLRKQIHLYDFDLVRKLINL